MTPYPCHKLHMLIFYVPGYYTLCIMFFPQITYPDFHLYEMLDQHQILEPSLLNGMDNLKVHQMYYYGTFI